MLIMLLTIELKSYYWVVGAANDYPPRTTMHSICIDKPGLYSFLIWIKHAQNKHIDCVGLFWGPTIK